VPHGMVCAALLPHIIEANVKALRGQEAAESARGLTRYAEIGRKLPGWESANDAEAIDACAQFTSKLAQELNIPPLKQFGIQLEHITEMVSLARKASSMRFNPVVLSDESLAAALAAAIG
jgi:alcohol dehydrogenase class IV